MVQAGVHSRVWRGRVLPDQRAAHEQFLTWLRGDEARSILSRLPLTEYRLEQHGDELTATISATEPTGLVRFLRFDRFWPAAWEFVAAERPATPLPAPETLGPALRAYWWRGEDGVHPDTAE